MSRKQFFLEPTKRNVNYYCLSIDNRRLWNSDHVMC